MSRSKIRKERKNLWKYTCLYALEKTNVYFKCKLNFEAICGPSDRKLCPKGSRDK